MDMWLLVRLGCGLLVLGLAGVSFWRAAHEPDFFSGGLYGSLGLIGLGGAYLAASPGSFLSWLLF